MVTVVTAICVVAVIVVMIALLEGNDLFDDLAAEVHRAAWPRRRRRYIAGLAVVLAVNVATAVLAPTVDGRALAAGLAVLTATWLLAVAYERRAPASADHGTSESR